MKFDEAAAAAIGFAWFVVGLVVFVVVALVTPRHSLAARVAAAVWLLPLVGGVLAGLWRAMPDLFDARPSLRWPWRRVTEPVREDLRSREK